VEIGIEGGQFLFWEYINSNIFAVSVLMVNGEPPIFLKCKKENILGEVVCPVYLQYMCLFYIRRQILS
jgi:hypothetical protein